jgi:hypothetical protein
MALILSLLTCVPDIDGPQRWETFAEYKGMPIARPIVCRETEFDARLAGAFEACTTHDPDDLHIVQDCEIVKVTRLGEPCLPESPPSAGRGEYPRDLPVKRFL